MSTKILVVEDSPSMCALISSVVEDVGYEAVSVGSGEEALGNFVSQRIDIAILDVELPGINGFETCKKLRGLRKEWFPVIYLSAMKSDDDIIKGLDVGGDAYVAKPVSIPVLASILKALGRISEMKRDLDHANRELQKLANYDGLTKILNRRGFDDALCRHWKQWERGKVEFALGLIDVDHFKLYNDKYGHLQGDSCLTSVAQCLEKSLFRPMDIVARYGGEEFVVLLPDTTLEGAQIVVERLLDDVRSLNLEHETSSTADVVTVSMGLALSSFAEDAEDLIKKTDAALYDAKRAGRNQWIIANLVNH